MSVARLVVLLKIVSLLMDAQKKLFSDAAHTGVGGCLFAKNRRVLVFLSYFTRKREGVEGCVCLPHRQVSTNYTPGSRLL
jgi:hypothetical protein